MHSDRATRTEFILTTTIIPLILFGIAILFDADSSFLQISLALIGFFWIYEVTARRLHDCNVSGFFTLPCMLTPAFILLYFYPPTQGPNRFGPDPRDARNDSPTVEHQDTPPSSRSSKQGRNIPGL
ncbi:hypothetical protein CO610_10080 [Lysobacteraceae bacterium NML95-0200]|nr:hypothetical protein CO610_10080 [Xanthomonadaceae bacterium NML95-0200]